MKKLLMVLLVGGIFVSGCVLPHSGQIGGVFLIIPGLCLVEKNIKELDAMIEAEERAISENVQRKNPAYFLER